MLISMPLINRWTVFDLMPGRSVVQKLLDAGLPIYLIDWGRRFPEHADLTIADLVDGTLRRCTDRARRHAATLTDAPLQAIGYCVGGTFLAAFCALHPTAFERVAFVATPIDFHASGRLHLWADPDRFPVDDIIDGWGNFPADLLRTSFDWLRPSNMTRKWKTLVDRVDQDGFTDVWSAIERWNTDPVDFPGEAYREYVKRCYFDNALVEGGWNLAGRSVELGAVGVPALSLAADSDHIVPPPAAHALERVWGGAVTTQTVRGGHVGICLGRSMPSALIGWIQA